MTPILRGLALPAVLVATLAVSSCSSGSSTPTATGTPSVTGTPSPVGPPATGSSNTADVEFANTMAFYHRSAQMMADLAPSRARDARVKALARTIKQAEGPEFTRMSGWLAAAGIPAPSVTDGRVIGHTMPGMGGQTKAMISKPEMAALGKATGSSFDRMWLQLMIRHQEGAAVTAKAQLAKGVNADARQLAQSVIDRQSAQVATMKSIIAGISGR